jgi:hypothetical protein
MTSLLRARPRSLTLLAAALAAGAACGGLDEPHGSPILTQIYWVAGGAQLLAWSRDPDTAMVSPVPPFASEVDFVFDRRLDGARLEDIITMGGVATVRPKDPPAVRASWPDMATANSVPPFALVVDYNSAPIFGGATSYIFARPAVPGFPSRAVVTFELDSSVITSAYGDPPTVPDSVPVKTSALSVSIGASRSAVAPTYQLPLAFTNRLPVAPPTSPLVHVTANGGAVPYKLLADATLASRWYLAAADCLGGWPASTTFTVKIDADFADAFGGKLGGPAEATFSTGAVTTAAADASCSIPDASVADGDDASDAARAPDASDDADGPSDDGGAADGGTDAGLDVAADAPAPVGDGAADAG